MSDHGDSREGPEYGDGAARVEEAGESAADPSVGGKRRRWHDGWWEERSLPEKILLGIGFGILALGLAFLFGWIVMLLWNWLMPDIFGLKKISYWQGWGLVLLSSILFKGGGGSKGDRTDRKRKKELRRYIRKEDCDK
jgi:hypothetical protein